LVKITDLKKSYIDMMEINLGQYQQVYALPTGITTSQYTTEILKIFNIDGSKYTIKEIREIIDSIKIPSVDPLKRFIVKIDGQEYGVVKNIMKSTFNEWISFESLIGASPTEEDTIKNLHKILAIYVRPLKRKWLRKVLVPLDKLDIKKNEEAMKRLTIQEALSINVFFYLQEIRFIQGIKKRYLNQLTLEIQNEDLIANK
jgi:hypothetical protein